MRVCRSVARALLPTSPLLYAIAALWLLLWTMVGLIETALAHSHPRVPLWHPIAIVLISDSRGGYLARVGDCERDASSVRR